MKKLIAIGSFLALSCVAGTVQPVKVQPNKPVFNQGIIPAPHCWPGTCGK